MFGIQFYFIWTLMLRRFFGDPICNLRKPFLIYIYFILILVLCRSFGDFSVLWRLISPLESKLNFLCLFRLILWISFAGFLPILHRSFSFLFFLFWFHVSFSVSLCLKFSSSQPFGSKDPEPDNAPFPKEFQTLATLMNLDDCRGRRTKGRTLVFIMNWFRRSSYPLLCLHACV